MNTLKKNLWKTLIITSFLVLYGNPSSPVHRPLSILFAQGLGFVEGVISDKSTGRTIPDVTVTLKQSGLTIASVITPDAGTYRLEAPPGDYDMDAVKEGFRKKADKVAISSGKTVTKDIALVPIKTGTDARKTVKTTGTQSGSSKTTDSFPAFLKGTISARETAETISGATVTVEQAGRTVASGITLDDGSYFFRVRPGSYTIIAVKDRFAQGSDPVSVSAFEIVNRDITLSAAMATPGCEDGGIPARINVSPGLLIMRPGEVRMVRVRVSKEGRAGCSIEVMINCTSGCDKIRLLNDSVITDSRGIAAVEIEAIEGKKGMANVTFSVGDLEFKLPIVITGKPLQKLSK